MDQNSVIKELLAASKRLQDMLAQLNQSAVSEVLGIVKAGGISASHTRGDELWTLMFDLEIWKTAGGEVRNQTLTIRKPIRKEEFDSIKNKVNPYDILRIRARIAEQNAFGTPQGLLVEIVEKVSSDAELNNWAIKLQEPVTFQDAKLGVFTLDRRIDWYETKVLWGSTMIRLRIGNGDHLIIAQTLKQAHVLWNAQAYWDETNADFAANELLDNLNENWLQEGEVELNPVEFKKKIKLESILIAEDGSFEFGYNDGNLFGGHWIKVTGRLSEGPKYAVIEG